MKERTSNWLIWSSFLYVVLIVLTIGCAIKVFFAASSLAWSAHSLLGSVPVESRDSLSPAYWLVSVYGLVLAICSAILIVSAFASLKGRRKFQLVRAIGAVVIAICGGHFAYALIGNSTSEFGEAVTIFSDVLMWLPGLMIFTILCFELMVHVTSRNDVLPSWRQVD
jgi:hypothetical protein